MQSKGMEDSTLKELNEMEVTKESDTELKKNGYEGVQATLRQLQGPE